MTTLERHSSRSSQWPAFRDRWIAGRPCAVCNAVHFIEAHHVIPFEIAPELELSPSNLIALCSDNRGCDCHLLFGHLGSFLCYNPHIFEDARYMQFRIAQRDRYKNQQDSVKDFILTEPPQ
jgi:hypothetical protein